MKKIPYALIATTLACSLASMPTTAFATAGWSGTARQAIRAGISQAAMQGGTASLSDTMRKVQSMAQTAGNLEIKQAGTYVLCGNVRGTVKVNPGSGPVTLVMNDVVIDGNGGPAISAVSGDSLTISMPAGTNSRVNSSGTGFGCRGTIQSGVDMFFEGDGNLMVVGDRQDAVRTENANLTFGGGSFEIVTAGNGMAVEGRTPGMLRVNAGDFTFRAGEAVSPCTTMGDNRGTFRSFDRMPADSYDQFVREHAWNDAPQVPVQQASGSQQGQMPGGAMGSGQQQASGQQQVPGQQQIPSQQQGQQGPMPGGDGGQAVQQVVGSTDTAGEIVTSTAVNNAATLVVDLENATYYVISDEDSQVKISDAGTYVVSGEASDGNITVKKGTTGVVLVLEDLDLTSATGATLSVNKEAEVKIVISGDVTLTDNENPADEESTDEAVADAFDGAAIKVKADSAVYVTGDGTLTINGDAKNGIKGGDNSSIIIDGANIKINAANDGINTNYDVTLLSGDLTIDAEDDAIHADHILTIGDQQTGEGPDVNITRATEGLEGTVVNIFGGDVSVRSTDDAINAANKDGVYEGELDYSVNMTGGDVTIVSSGDGIDSNGNVNLVGGEATISSSSVGGEAGIDYDGELYVSDEFTLSNGSGVSGSDMMGGMVQPGQQMDQQQMGQPGQQGGPGMGGQR